MGDETMAESHFVYQDEWGEIIDRPSNNLIELRWFDTTSRMPKDEFQKWLRTFADQVRRLRRPLVLIDGTSFKMNPTFMDAEWRDINIIPQYNAAGVTKFAFHMPSGIPLVGKEPRQEGPGQFPTGYFDSREDALDWLRA